ALALGRKNPSRFPGFHPDEFVIRLAPLRIKANYHAIKEDAPLFKVSLLLFSVDELNRAYDPGSRLNNQTALFQRFPGDCFLWCLSALHAAAGQERALTGAHHRQAPVIAD